jgi:hypothetical protein
LYSILHAMLLPDNIAAVLGGAWQFLNQTS